MKRRDDRRRNLAPAVEGLGCRTLPTAGAIHELGFSIPAIKGTIDGTVTSDTPISAKTSVVDFTASGKANIIGDGQGTGQFTITSQVVKKHPTNDTYKNGSATVTGTTDIVAITYAGTGHTNANGSFTATLKGKARSVAGLDAGLGGSFTASISGNNRTGTFKITFTIKV